MATTFGLPNCTGIAFQSSINPFPLMPDCAVADLTAAPLTSIGNDAALSAWTSWPGGTSPAFVAQPGDGQQEFRARIIRTLQAAGMVGVIVYEYSRGGFFERNQNFETLSGG